jgi:hypothetical protein
VAFTGTPAALASQTNQNRPGEHRQRYDLVRLHHSFFDHDLGGAGVVANN